MKIGVISTANRTIWGGSEELWATTVEEALKERLEVAVSICNDALIPLKFSALHHNDAVRIFWRRPLLRGRAERILSKIVSPFREIFRWKPDVICISQGSTYQALWHKDLLDSLYSSGIPYVVVCQYNDDYSASRGIRLSAIEFFEHAFHVVFVSRQNMTSVERQLARTLGNAIVLQNPVNLFDLSGVTWPSSRQVSLANVARLDATYKGQDILLEVLGRPMWRSRDWRLRLYGEGKDRKYLEELARHYAIAERVEFCGHIKNIRSIWEENQLLVLPSRGEGTPLALIEAMLCGRAAVVTDVGGNAEWIEDDESGFVAEAPTAKSFGAALERAWAARAKWQMMGKQARNAALINLDKSPGKSLLNVLVKASSQRITERRRTATDRKTKDFSKLAVAAKATD